MSQVLQYGVAGEHRYGMYYKHSGRVTALGIILTVIVGLPAAALAGWIYAYVDLYSPIIYLNILLAFGFGIGMAAICGAVLRWGKVRNLPVSLSIIGLMTLAAYYVCWVAWVIGVMDRFNIDRDFSFLDLALSPIGLWDIITRINEVGTWAIGRASSSSAKTNVSGLFLTVVWLGEAALIIGSAFHMGRKFAGDLPFCERCNCWCGKPSQLAVIGPGDAHRMRREMEAGTYIQLQELIGRQSENHWWSVELQTCHGCTDFYTVSVIDCVRTVDRNGKVQIKRTVVVPRLNYGRQRLEELREATIPVPSVPMAGPVEVPPPYYEIPTTPKDA